jgi:diguanylate cyclase (GGDEF)-like protein
MLPLKNNRHSATDVQFLQHLIDVKSETINELTIKLHSVSESQWLSERRLRQMTALNSLNDNLLRCGEVDEALNLIAGTIADIFTPWFAQFVMPQSENAAEKKGRSYNQAPTLPSKESSRRRYAADSESIQSDQNALIENTSQSGSLIHCNELRIQEHIVGVFQVHYDEDISQQGLEELKTFTRIVSQSLKLRITNLLLQQNLKLQALHDPLTGLFNRRYLDATLQREIKRCEREEQALTVVMIDLDHFKRINDQYGHEAGDVVLRGLSKLLGQWSRSSDIVCRYGGEEFVIILAGALPKDVRPRLEDLRERMSQSIFFYAERALPAVTISLGVSQIDAKSMTDTAVLDRADRAMYLAKQTGRNRIVIG